MAANLETWVQMQQTYYDLKSSQTKEVSGFPPATRWKLQKSVSGEEAKHQHAENGDTELASARQYNASADGKFVNSMIPPDGGRTAWLQVLASCLININTFGLVNTFGAYQEFYASNYLRNHSESVISWIGTTQAALLLIVGAFSGPMFDMGYFRVTFWVAAMTLVFAQMMLSLSKEYYQIMLTQGILSGVCVGLLYIPSVASIPHYFHHRRGLAIGLALSGAPLGGIVYPIIFRALLTSVGFGWATRIVAFVGLVTLAIAGVLARPMDQLRKPARQFFDTSAPKELPFAAFMLSAFLTYNAWLVPYLLTPAFSLSVGTGTNTAFYLLAVLNTAQLFGRVIPAYLSDLIGPEWMCLVASAAPGVLGLSWISIATIGGWVEFELFYGFFSGTIATLPPLVMPYLCPNLAVLGTRLGMIYGCAGLGILMGSPIALALSDIEHGQFLGAQLWMGVLGLIGSATTLVFVLPASRLRKISQRNDKDKPTLRKDLDTIKRRMTLIPRFGKGFEREEAVRAIEPIFL
ncbi:hypothetical protein H2200_010285 [Cladophialophora chaetospira]|uniref:Major facilitator superfamily (MFS) profile domain-containing protein n=1 Tax=Cladophialophora chaetospira TaxID=386627 RepID=A0AA39CE28_9EURO|nr:hypothetical protein H2200_010285 [Cladophialophora chaetospira]